MRLDQISNLFRTAENESRHQLYEHETYELLKYLEGISPPEMLFLSSNVEYSDEELMSIPGDRVVLKVVSSYITHKTDTGGVKIVEKTAERIRETIQLMLTDIPDNYAQMLEQGSLPGVNRYSGLSGRELMETIKKDIKGFLLVRYVPSDLNTFGSELIVGIRNTREFGPVISAGIGGTDTELFAETFKKDRAFVTASTAMTTPEKFLDIFRGTVSYKKLAGLSRGQRPVDIDDELLECFSSFILLASHFSLYNPDAGYVIEELEINPLVFHDTHPVPLDGLCRFSRPGTVPVKRPWHKIENLLHPKSIAIMGVSTTRVNFGRIILDNILAEGFARENVRIIRPGIESFQDITCLPDLDSLDIKPDLLVVAVGAGQVTSIVESVTQKPVCESVMLIPGGMGETGESREMAELVNSRINEAHFRDDGGPVFLGANCLGVVSHPGKYDTLFIPEEKLPKQRGAYHRNLAFVSQSGAFMITRTSRLPELDPAYMISVGNQNDLTLGDMLSYLKTRDEIDVIAVYAEGFKDMDWLAFLEAVKQAVNKGKDVIIYKAGKTLEGKSATGSHTATLAGDYRVFESCVRQAGGIVAEDFTMFEDLLVIAQGLNKKEIKGNKVAALSGAGFEAVGMADNVDGINVKLASLSEKTVKRLCILLEEKGLSHLTEVKNPLDINPGSDDDTHLLAVKYLAMDENVNAVVVGLDPLSPSTRSLDDQEAGPYDYNKPGSIVHELPKLVNRLDKPVIGVVDAGRLFDLMVKELKKNGMIIFRSADRAVRALGIYLEARLYKRT